ncbi:MAG: PepSY domain-containing protein [Porphyrobacter sp.]|nr:PepSY domain-containing protein [Porphyrobacter sp.]
MKFSGFLALALLLLSSAVTAQRPATISALEAVKIAEHGGNWHVTDVEKDRWGSKAVYEVEVVSGTKSATYIIDASNGKVLRQNSSTLRNFWGEVFGRSNEVYLSRARSLSSIISSLEGRTGGKVLSASFDVEDGTAYYEVEFLSQIGRTKLYLDPVSGQRLNFIPDD